VLRRLFTRLNSKPLVLWKDPGSKQANSRQQACAVDTFRFCPVSSSCNQKLIICFFQCHTKTVIGFDFALGAFIVPAESRDSLRRQVLITTQEKEGHPLQECSTTTETGARKSIGAPTSGFFFRVETGHINIGEGSGSSLVHAGAGRGTA